LGLNPRYTPAFLSRARNRSRVGDHQGAIEDLTYVLSYEPNNAAVLYNRGLSRQDMGDYQGAAVDFQRASTLFQSSGDMANAQIALRAMHRLPIGGSSPPNYPAPEATPNSIPFGGI
jgi:tetratricopeptide (TPR) repeat protein